MALLTLLTILMAACGGGAEDGADTAADGEGDTATSTPGAPNGGGTEADGSGCDAGSAPYRIGVLVGLTGSYAALGEPERDAAEAYAEWANSQGGVNGHPIELVVADTTSSESEAVNQLRRLATQEEVIGIIGPSSSGEGVAIKPVATQLQVPTMVMASTRAIVTPVEEAEYVFKNFPSTDLSLRAQLSFAQEQGAETVAIVGANNAYGQEPIETLPEVAGEFGLEVVGSETFDPAATDMTAQLTTLQADNPDVILVWAVNPANAIIAANSQQLGMDDVQFSHSPGAASFGFIETAGEAANGQYVQGTTALVPDSVPEDSPQHEILTQFIETYRDEYGEDPNQFAGNAWDAMALLSEALQAADVNPCDAQAARTALRDSLESNINGFPGINAIYDFGPDDHAGQGLEGLALLQVQDGEFTLASTLTEASPE
jgi:branched-chain amino acid transport system substrate-binding protein